MTEPFHPDIIESITKIRAETSDTSIDNQIDEIIDKICGTIMDVSGSHTKIMYTTNLKDSEYLKYLSDFMTKFNKAYSLGVKSGALSQLLLEYGFDEDFVRGYTGTYRPLTHEQKAFIGNDYSDIYELAHRFKDISYFTYLTILALNLNPDILSRLLTYFTLFGLDIEIIKTKILYPSGRPRIDMRYIINLKPTKLSEIPILKSSTDVLIQSSHLNTTGLLNQDLYIPVIRYGKGMQRGSYQIDSNDEYCGKFYYFEPGSTILLQSKKTLITPNKYTAMVNLFGIEETIERLVNRLDGQGNIIIGKSVPKEYGKYPDSFIKYIFGAKYDTWTEVLIDMSQGKFNFSEHLDGMYAIEDRFDQLICKKSRQENIDIVIFSTMTGYNRIVSEILDTRKDTFDHLIMKF